MADGDEPDSLMRAIASAPPLAPPSRIASTVGNYKIVRLLGSGGMGVVYLAEHVTLGRKAVIKFVQARLTSAPEFAKRFLTEAKAAASIRHAGIIDVFDYGQDERGDGYIAMEYLDGESLKSRLARQHPMPIDLAVALGTQIASALAAAHAAGVVHRDLKPDNIFVVRDPETSHGLRAKVLDFGLAKSIAPDEPSVTSSGDLVGTPLYMAPEQCRSAPDIDHRADIYALGCIVFEMVCGRPPFVERSVGDLLTAHITAEPPSARTLQPSVPEHLDRAIARALAKRPAERFPTIEKFGAALTAPSLDVRRRSRSWIVAPVVAAALVAGSVALWPRARSTSLPTVRIVAHNAGNPDDAWLAPVLERLARRRLDDVEDRRFWLADGDHADRTIELVLRRSATAVSIEVSGIDGVGPVNGASIMQALDQLVPQLAHAVAGPGPMQPSPNEREEMRRLGARSFAAYRIFRQCAFDYSETNWVDSRVIAERIQRAIDLDPGWAHARVLQVFGLGLITPEATSALDEWDRRRDRDASRDPIGDAVLLALRDGTKGSWPAAADRLDPLFSAHPNDLVLGAVLMSATEYGSRVDDAIAVDRELHRRWPALQWGGNLINDLRRAGRLEEAEHEIRRWIADDPEAQQAWFELIGTETEAGHPAEAELASRRLLLIYGESPERLATLCDALLAAGKLDEAREIAERMRRSTPQSRARASYRLGVIATLEGRFGSAYEILTRAAEEARAFGAEGGLTQVLAILRELAPLVDESAKVRTYTAELLDAYAKLGFPVERAATAYDLALLDRGATCPDRTPFLAAITEPAARKSAQRYMARSAAQAGCGSCAEAVREGLTSDEFSPRSLVELGKCAAQTGELDLARKSYEHAIRLAFGFYAGEPSPYDAMLARYEIAGLLAKSGDRDGAKREYQIILAAWGNPDRPLPLIADVRRALAALK